MKPSARTQPHALRRTRTSAATLRRAPGWGGGRVLLAWLLCALLAAPLLGRLHALAHPGAQGHAAQGEHSAEPIAHTWVDLLAEHPSSADCQLFDHLALAGLLAVVQGRERAEAGEGGGELVADADAHA